jgi:signal transduction histidine kinase/CheY-like chemotaxis protein/ABC-type glycerol-3-phosphate transport system permease component
MKIKTALLLGFLSISTTVIITAIVAIVELRTLYGVSQEVSLKNAPLADAAMEIKLSTTTAHLWLEELLTGAEEKTAIEEVWKQLDDSFWYIDAIVTGGKNLEGTFYPVNDQHIEETLFSVQQDLENFRKIARLRFDNHFGDQKLDEQALDDQFDALFDKIITAVDEVEEKLHLKIAADAEKITDSFTSAIIMLIVSTLLTFTIASLSAYFISRQMMKEVGGEPAEIAKLTQQLATGDLNLQFETVQGTGIYAAVQMMVKNLKAVIEDIVKVSQGLAQGHLNIMPGDQYQGDFIQIKTGLTTAAIKLGKATQKNAEQDWLKTGQAQLNDQLRGEQALSPLSKKIIDLLTTYVGGQVGLFYLVSHSDPKRPVLKKIASYAYTDNDNTPHQFEFGEGLIGQAALEKKMLSCSHRPEEYRYITRSGLSQSIPRHVFIFPFLYENTVKGVIEIGFSEMLTDSQRAFLEQAMPHIGIAVNMAESRTRMQALLAQSQRQTEELQTQSEELQAQQEEMQQINDQLQSQREELEDKQDALQHRNAELQNQSEELQSQSEELQTQQEELKQTNEELEERTQELERQKEAIQHKNIALEHAQVEMEKAKSAIELKAHELELASQYKSEFLANMSHELRTPLNSLLILSQLLGDNKSGNLTEKQVEYAQTIQSAGSDLLRLINDILDLSKVEAGKMEVNIEKLFLSDLVESLAQKFAPLAQEKGLPFEIKMAEDLPEFLYTDPLRLKQILTNLLSNAFKFTNQGDVRLKMNKEKHFITMRITDTGIGIPSDKQKLIFEAFQQVDGTTSRSYGGTGLGLSISRQLAKLMGGEISLESEAGVGSTFTFSLPETLSLSSPEEAFENNDTVPAIDDSENETAKQLIEYESESGAEAILDEIATQQFEDKTLLIIEDDKKFATILIDLGHEKGFKCLYAEEGKIGIEFAEKYQPNAIILDISLPHLDGWSVLEKLKENPDTRHIPVHFLSAAEQNSLEATKKGAIGFLHKPVNIKQLGQVFKKIEQFITKSVKEVLVIVDNEPHQQKILELIKGDKIETKLAITPSSALGQLRQQLFDCVILDMDIDQGSGAQLLEKMQQEDGLCETPVIVYCDRELTTEEEALLLQCADHLPVKSVSSSERLLDETTLFLHQVEANLPAQKRQMLRMVHDKESILTQKKILIVDDDVRNVFALATVLEERNMEVLSGNTGVEGLALLEEHRDIAMVLMDIMMPEMDGYEAMRKIRGQSEYRNLPIIALTAKAMKGDKAKCIDAGANDYLSKPVDTDKLISLMRVWLYR